MNGDLTAYFHPDEIDSYIDIYHDIEGIESYFPSLGNHDYDHKDGGMFFMDQWFTNSVPKSCNAKHSIAYMKRGICGDIPNFDEKRIVGYDPESLAYSWEEGTWHFVVVNFHPTFESASTKIKSSMKWLEKDLTKAKASGMNSVIFVHAAQGLNAALESIVDGKNVIAFFAGHTHRCAMNKCEGPVTLDVPDIEDPAIMSIAEKCLPATLELCGGNADSNFMSLYLTKYSAVKLPSTRLWSYSYPTNSTGTCPYPDQTYLNKTDNTLLCKPYSYSSPQFPFSNTTQQKIPIFWSGSSSFEIFLKASFHDDKMVVEAITAAKGHEGRRYVDVNELPNAVYPYHSQEDFEAQTVYI